MNQPIYRLRDIIIMSLLNQHSVYDLEKVTIDLMNILYRSDWKETEEDQSDDFLFKRISKLQDAMLNDLNISIPEKTNSELYTIIRKLQLLQVGLFGYSNNYDGKIEIKDCIEETKFIINNLNSSTRTCIIV